MRPSRVTARVFLAFLLSAPLVSAGLDAQATLTAPAAPRLANPESVGFSSAALAKMDEGMQAIVDQKHLSGVVTLVARHGKVVQHKAYGYKDLERRTPMTLDTITRIYSMTKPVTGVAMMMLYEEGKWKPTDPVSKYIPEFKNLKVFTGMGGDGVPTVEAPAHEPTMGELMSHSAGFTYGLFGNTPVDKLYQAAGPLNAPSLQVFIDRVAALPLLYQPGTRWVYSVSVDIQGYLVEKLSGKTFPDFLRTRIFEPLGMPDTAFFVPQEKLSRVATIYSWNQSKSALVAERQDPAITKMPGLPSGGGGLYSTAADYFRFAQMVANGGELDGKRLLKKSTIDMMHTNVLSDQVLNQNEGIGQARFSPAQGFGYDFAVVLDPERAGRQVGKGSYWWWGAAGTWFWIDPTNDLVVIGIIQRRGGVPGSTNHEDVSRRVVAEALTHPEK
jgi:CubicO group peptidase (beta-lactamase class C family)